MFKDFSSSDSVTVSNIGNILKAARKFEGVNQSHVAAAMGCSQSALSKMEHGSLVPSAPQWFAFCNAVQIPVDSLTRGLIDRHIPAFVPEKGDEVQRVSKRKLPKRYASFNGQKVKSLLPFLSFIAKNIKDSEYEQFIQKTGLQADFFYDCDNQVNLRFLLDIIGFILEHFEVTEDTISKIAQENINPSNHGLIHREYVQAENLIGILRAYETFGNFYQKDILFRIEMESSSHLMVSYAAESYAEIFFREASQAQLNFLRDYRKYHIQFMTAYNHESPRTVDYLEKESGSSDKEFYRVNL